jgi:hypothetical protein
MRKLTIANGEGLVHGNHIDLEDQFGITLADAIEVSASRASRATRAKVFASPRSRTARGVMRAR